MPPVDVRNMTEKLADAADHHEAERWRAACTVRARVVEPAAQQELLACLGLDSAVRPLG